MNDKPVPDELTERHALSSLVAFGSIAFAHTARRLRATGPQKTSALSSCQDRAVRILPLTELDCVSRRKGECRLDG
jgi:hypothetical protein